MFQFLLISWIFLLVYSKAKLEINSNNNIKTYPCLITNVYLHKLYCLHHQFSYDPPYLEKSVYFDDSVLSCSVTMQASQVHRLRVKHTVTGFIQVGQTLIINQEWQICFDVKKWKFIAYLYNLVKLIFPTQTQLSKFPYIEQFSCNQSFIFVKNFTLNKVKHSIIICFTFCPLINLHILKIWHWPF
jgi:hypothetical protein